MLNETAASKPARESAQQAGVRPGGGQDPVEPTALTPESYAARSPRSAAAAERGADVLERDPGMPSSTWRLRSDAWEYLRYAVKLLALGDADARDNAGQSEIRRSLRALQTIEMYWAGFGQRYVAAIGELIEAEEYLTALDRIGAVMQRMRGAGSLDSIDRDELTTELPDDPETPEDLGGGRHRFEVLVVDEMSATDRDALKAEMMRMRAPGDQFIYELVIVPSAEDALAAALTNPNIQACVIRPGFSTRSRQPLSRDLRETLALAAAENTSLDARSTTALSSVQRVMRLADTLAGIRPELDLYLVAGAHIEDLAGALTRRFRRVFRREDRLELHLSLLRRISHLYDTPFFTAIQEHARRPAGVFHALPISRGGSVAGSKWIRDMVDFYGLNLLLAETSATSGGLDSLLAPVHTLKKAQELAARAFGSKQTFFVTNGTSTANKIVHQALVAPDDVVIVDRNCHKSHHHALMLSGARVAYLDAYPLNDYAFYGAVPINRIKQLLLDYRAAGRLDEVRMVTLTNCTFDGIVYDPERVMAECLAIKPDLVFLWDEAWFAFAAFHPVTRHRTAMAAAKRLEQRLKSAEHAAEYAEQRARLFDAKTGKPAADEAWLAERLLPSPNARVRVYATQSTHKTLTALRQGSMIHVRDQDWRLDSEESFHEAYMTHTSTSPNYQILASLDLGRRQVELEGFELVQRQLDLATSLASAVARHPLLRRTFRVLSAHELIPAEYRETNRPMPLRDGLATMWAAWTRDEFVVDPSRITIEISRTGVDGDTFKHEHLMDRYGIQVNKTSRNTVLFMTNIGTSRSAVAYLIEVLVKLAERFEEDRDSLGLAPLGSHRASQEALGGGFSAEPADVMPPLPDFSAFAERFRAPGHAGTGDLPDGDIRSAFYAGQRRTGVEYVSPAELRRRVEAGERPVSAGFVTPYPPGFPVLVPGQVVSREVLDFMAVLDTREIHGFDAAAGYRVLREG
ncbi:aminotransferase class I/II-fold pyridoxal phosphate-dependent enzyme [Leucobacter sp. cx-169]|uniref:aminotransferase class I/II-fold pyridoxal phosphate-dependent enzyme n=1 Tax=unclassified Leucobacter TaxID=2621730 RepID=UPI00165DFAE7|nr:aminotransferase class I/II-fold pyridoxal phosphate-dependent enzyme [Leucobacter sp. cx-169]